ncbi:uncharacterized protein K444DRAFT_609307 [Hyaloscypha bicolor E]|uniref:F-box domain-containing protein n=1 Tax=Hyaloscypha bicolor E TaxID=1095630 RepID=A0A2J6TLW8_9HELO|nr:uncharacterized protein K444DRAFT_609307 [Hyaloscypha bicolor E]PMD63987.1 hypothetical protein K444DRAFT_609307 [Hyaloscypha bicolor E]
MDQLLIEILLAVAKYIDTEYLYNFRLVSKAFAARGEVLIVLHLHLVFYQSSFNNLLRIP